MSQIQTDQRIRAELASRGITETTGVFGNHKVQLGKGSSIRLDSIESASIPFAGFRTVTKIARGKAGLQNSATEVLKTLHDRSGTLDAGKLLGSLKAMQTQLGRLDKLGQLTQAQKNDGMWTFTAAVQGLSNRELSAVYQSFTSAEMDLLQTALQHEGQTNPKASDARKAAVQLFDLQALVLKEISNRSISEQIAQTGADMYLEGMPGGNADDAVALPKSLTQQFGSTGAVTQSTEAHDITAANLLTLTETGANSATIREKSALDEQAKLHARRLDDVTVKEMGDMLRQAELTINIQTEHLVGGPNAIFQHSNDPLVNIFHLHDQGINPKGPGYLDERNATEELLFPELKGHNVQADERPMYGALNIRGQRGGAVSYTAGYGRSAIVLKPEVAKRATYIANDTFYAPLLNLSEERRKHFYMLLDGANNPETRQRFGADIPQSLITALKDPNSAEHKDFEAYLDMLVAEGNATVINFRDSSMPESLMRHFPYDPKVLTSVYSTFKGFLTECFGDVTATRSIMATHDNLESLITQMDSVDGNNLARAVQNNRNGEQPKACLTGAQYIEAQIHGPIIPSHDIAEIRINMEDVPEDQRDTVRAQARQYEQDTGIKVTIFENDIQEIDDNANTITLNQQEKYNAQHLDLDAIEHGRQDYLDHLPDKINEFIRFHNLDQGLPRGVLRLEGNALEKLAQKFQEEVQKWLTTPSAYTANEVLEVAFERVTRPMLEQKAQLLLALENAGLHDAQKAAVTTWVVSAKALRSPAELQVILRQAREQAAVFQEIANAEPPLTPEQLFTRMHTFTQNMDRDLTELVNTFNDADFGPDDIKTEQNRISFMALSLLQHGEPPMDGATLQKLFSRLNSPDVRTMMGQLYAVLSDRTLQNSPDVGRVELVSSQLFLNAVNVGNLVGQHFSNPQGFQGELSLLPEPLRAVLRETAPDVAGRLDELHPGYPPFPAPAQPENMPQSETDRRNFLVNNVMDGYINHEKTFEEGTSYHGRGHIARAYIFANVMCNILEEQGIKVDKNAVLCGIAGHDLGRKGSGHDNWEARSAEMTTEAMRNAFGPNAMGDAYEQQVRDSIDRHKGKTVEAMVLNAADSLDIGRIGPGVFQLNEFPFLRGKEGEIPEEWADNMRKQLEKEANLLQRMTNPLCANRNVIDRLQQDADNASSPFQENMLRDQKTELLEQIRLEFAADWDVPSDAYMKRFEDTVRDNPQLFPLLSKYYH